ncbi:tyrosine-type recombinase/integrase [Novosphingobium sp. MBES04]|uniref:tyrosine-type recombinase/integrase n=1 Tax=Novosphingobium sp. MBES04 TaxID=1206458 RepID=UPI000693B67C|nr:site-specific integrase [Novosphingobium sp. MBES04]GAM06372.1 phage integrase family protein [Novosphingobium sp. MBES04]
MTGYLASIQDKPSYSRRIDAWKAMKLYWDGIDPKLIDEPMARTYYNRRRVGPATVRYELMQLSTALGWATTNGPKLDRRIPVWLPKPPETKRRHLDHREFDRFFEAVVAPHARIYMMLGLYTMARPTAILQLTWDRVDFMRRQIDFTPPGHVRTSKRRTIVPIATDLLPVLQEAFMARTCESVIERGGQPIACIKKAFQAASERSGVHATPYTLRHTGAVWAAEAGVPMPQLAQFMGHDDDRTTQKHYARFSPGYLLGVADAIRKRA